MSRFRTLVIFSVLSLTAVACNTSKKSADSASAPATVVIADTSAGVAVAVPAEPGVELQVAAPPGAAVFLVDSKGRALYTLDTSSGKPADFKANCANNFTPVAGHSTSAPSDTSVKSSMTGSISRADGSKQATYNGKPLYYYNGDQAQADAKGNGLKACGATAHLVSPSGTAASKKGN